MAKGKYPEEITVTVLNWEKHNPRKDVKKNWWFKVSNDIFDDPRIQRLTPEMFATFIFLLSRCSKEGSEMFVSRISVATQLLSMRTRTQYLQALAGLERNGLVSLTYNQKEIRKREERDVQVKLEQRVTCGEPFAPLTDSVSKPPFVASLGNGDRDNTSLESGDSLSPGVGQSPDLETPTVVRKKRQPKKSILEPFSSDFELVWEIYPRHVGKRSAFVRYQRMFTTEQDKENLIKAVTNYKNQCQSLRTEEKYIKHLTSFIGTLNDQPWLDYVSNNETETRGKQLTNEELLAYLNGENT